MSSEGGSRTSSARDLFRAVRRASSHEHLKDELRRVAETFPRLALNLLCSHLIGDSIHSSDDPRLQGHLLAVKKRNMGIREAFHLLGECGFDERYTNVSQLNNVMEHFVAVQDKYKAPPSFGELPLNIDRAEDFQFAVAHYSDLNPSVRQFFGLQFIKFWQSIDGWEKLKSLALQGANDKTVTVEHHLQKLLRDDGHFRRLYADKNFDPVINVSQRLSPDRAVYAFSGEDTFETTYHFLSTKVDMNMNCDALIEKLKRCGFWRPELYCAYEGLLHGMLEREPRALVEMLLGIDAPRAEEQGGAARGAAPERVQDITRDATYGGGAVFRDPLRGGPPAADAGARKERLPSLLLCLEELKPQATFVRKLSFAVARRVLELAGSSAGGAGVDLDYSLGGVDFERIADMTDEGRPAGPPERAREAAGAAAREQAPKLPSAGERALKQNIERYLASDIIGRLAGTATNMMYQTRRPLVTLALLVSKWDLAWRKAQGDAISPPSSLTLRAGSRQRECTQYIGTVERGNYYGTSLSALKGVCGLYVDAAAGLCGHSSKASTIPRSSDFRRDLFRPEREILSYHALFEELMVAHAEGRLGGDLVTLDWFLAHSPGVSADFPARLRAPFRAFALSLVGSGSEGQPVSNTSASLFAFFHEYVVSYLDLDEIDALWRRMLASLTSVSFLIETLRVMVGKVQEVLPGKRFEEDRRHWLGKLYNLGGLFLSPNKADLENTVLGNGAEGVQGGVVRAQLPLRAQLPPASIDSLKSIMYACDQCRFYEEFGSKVHGEMSRRQTELQQQATQLVGKFQHTGMPAAEQAKLQKKLPAVGERTRRLEIVTDEWYPVEAFERLLDEELGHFYPESTRRGAHYLANMTAQQKTAKEKEEWDLFAYYLCGAPSVVFFSSSVLEKVSNLLCKKAWVVDSKTVGTFTNIYLGRLISGVMCTDLLPHWASTTSAHQQSDLEWVNERIDSIINAVSFVVSYSQPLTAFKFAPDNGMRHVSNAFSAEDQGETEECRYTRTRNAKFEYILEHVNSISKAMNKGNRSAEVDNLAIKLYPLVKEECLTIEKMVQYLHSCEIKCVISQELEDRFWDLIQLEGAEDIYGEPPVPAAVLEGTPDGGGTAPHGALDRVALDLAATGGTRSPLDQLKVLKGCRFSLVADLRRQALEEDDECDWSAVDGDATSPQCYEGAPSTEQHEDAAPEKAQSFEEHAFFRRFGPRGESMLLSFLTSALPSQLLELFLDGGGGREFKDLCIFHVSGSWCPPPRCDLVEAKALATLVCDSWVPQCFWGAACPLVWDACDKHLLKAMSAARAAGGARTPATPGSDDGSWVDLDIGRLEDCIAESVISYGTAAAGAGKSVGSTGNAENPAKSLRAAVEECNALMKTLLLKRAVDLDVVPPRWWHCVDISSIEKEGDIVRMLVAKQSRPSSQKAQDDLAVVVHPSDIPASLGGFAALEGATQELVLGFWSGNLQVLAEYSPRVAGSLLPHLERLFAQLGDVQVQNGPLWKAGDGGADRESAGPRKNSGWNKVILTLLQNVKARVTAGTSAASGGSEVGEKLYCNEPNWLTSDEQLLLFKNCCLSEADFLKLESARKAEAARRERESKAKPVSGGGLPGSGSGRPAGGAADERQEAMIFRPDESSARLLADLMEAKCVDPKHLFSLVSFILKEVSVDGTQKQLHDSALRAMGRLDREERDSLIADLLRTPGKLPLQVIFSLSVSQLATDDMEGGVLKQLDMLTGHEREIVENLTREANSTKTGFVHTYPRSPRVKRACAARFLMRYLRGDHDQPNKRVEAFEEVGGERVKKIVYLYDYGQRRKRDDRFFQLFLACADRREVIRHLLDVLARQLHPFPHQLFTKAFADHSHLMSVDDFVELVGYFPLEPATIRDHDIFGLIWKCGRQHAGAHNEYLSAFLGTLDQYRAECVSEAASAPLKQILTTMLAWGEDVMMKVRSGGGEEVQEKLAASALLGQNEARIRESVRGLGDRALWLDFLATTWERGNPAVEAARGELLEALPGCDGAKKGAEQPEGKWFPRLSQADVKKLGVTGACRKMLVTVSSNFALTEHGLQILKEDPAFANTLNDTEYAVVEGLMIRLIAGIGKKSEAKDAQLVRKVVRSGIHPVRGLRLAVGLLQKTQAAEDVDLLGTMYLHEALPAATRRQLRLADSLGSAVWQQYGVKIQEAIIDKAVGKNMGFEALKDFDATRIDLVYS